MKMAENEIISLLFKTDAICVSPPNQPFWYTSGRLGPFYVNTHYLYGSERDALAMLLLIEQYALSDRLKMPQQLLDNMLRQYNEHEGYRKVIDRIVQVSKDLNFDLISGGERRDFFFSLLPAYFLKKPHLSIFKDMNAIYTDAAFRQSSEAYLEDLSGQRALHISDLITQASSYTRSWIPVIEERDAMMTCTITIVDRMQGGRRMLEARGVHSRALAHISPELFRDALDHGLVNQEQLATIQAFFNDPDGYMSDYLAAHPTFISEALKMGGKTAERAQTAIDKGYAPAPSCEST